jgi:Tol biopolymer transport system component/formylglycine-generating enzyme required for sulfatase activity
MDQVSRSTGRLVVFLAILVLCGSAAPAESGSLADTKITFRSRRADDSYDDIWIMNSDGTGLVRFTYDRTSNGPAWSPDGTKIAFHTGRGGGDEIYVANRDGTNEVNLTNGRGYDYEPTWSPDGLRMAFHNQSDIWVMNADGSGRINLTDSPLNNNTEAAWSPDGSEIAFARIGDRARNYSNIWVMNVDGTDLMQLTDSSANDHQPAWSPDGSRIAFRRVDGNADIYLMDADGSNLGRLTDHSAQDFQPTWSPDGSKIAFVSDRDGNTEIYTVNIDGSELTRLTDHPSADVEPDWSPFIDSPVHIPMFIHRETFSGDLGSAFGNPLAFAGEQLVFGQSAHDLGAPQAGSVVITDLEGNTVHRIINPTPEDTDHFGSRLAVYGDYLVVGAYLDDTKEVDAGAVYIFNRKTGNLIRTLQQSPPIENGQFGLAISVVGTTLLIGVPLDDTMAEDAGAVYAFDGDPSSASFGDVLRVIYSPSPERGELFGLHIAADERHILVGAPLNDTGSINSGAAYVYDSETLEIARTFVNPDPVGTEQFGSGIPVGSQLLIPAVSLTVGGVVYLFDIPGDLIHTFVNPNPDPDNRFGYKLASMGTYALIGAADVVHVFDTVSGLLSYSITSPSAELPQSFGNGIAVSGNRVLIGATKIDGAFLFEASETNQPPDLQYIGNRSIEENKVLSFVVSATDPDGDSVVYSVLGNPSGSSLSGDTFSWKPDYDQSGSYTVTFGVSDGNGEEATETITVTVSDVNRSPILTGIGIQSVEEGSALVIALSGSDADGDGLSYSVSGSPSGSSLTDNVFSWTPTYDQADSYQVTFTVSDGKGGTASEAATITVQDKSPDINPQWTEYTWDQPMAVGNSDRVTWGISNDGNADLVVSSITFSSGDFSVSPSSFTVPPGQTIDLAVEWSPSTAGAASATMTIESNDPDEGTISLPLYAIPGATASSSAQFSEPILLPLDLPGGAVAWNPWGADWGDYDGDGDQDLLLSLMSGPSQVHFSEIFRNDGNGVLTPLGAGLTQSAGQTKWGDFDNDNDLDVLQTGMYSGTKLYRNESGSFVPVSVDLAGYYNMQIDWGDYDNDGDLDILIIGMLGNTGEMAKVYRNNGDATFTDIDAGLPSGVAQGGAAKWGDFDNDGDADILLSGVPRNETATWIHFTKIFRNDAGSFTDISAGLPAITASGDWGDYDGDGDLDIVLSGRDHSQAGEVFVADVYRNDGNGAFVAVNAGLAGAQSSDVAWGDYDNDGDLDALITSNSQPDTKLYRNDQGSFVKAYSFPEYSSQDIGWVDFDNDGDLDAHMRGTGPVGLAIYRNLVSNSNAAPSAPTNLTSLVAGTTVTLAWDKASDAETDHNSLSYNLCVGTTPGGTDVVSPMADIGSGTRRVTRIGNTYLNSNWALKNLEPGTYYWRVQAIDNGYRGSAFSSERTFVIPESHPSIEVKLPGGATMEFMWMEPGAFMMGDEGSQHRVAISEGFYLGKYEVTQEQWEAVVGTSQADPSHPVVHISWEDAQAFVHQLNVAAGDSLYRLPTEAEWEYACRAGTATRWSFGDNESQLGDYAWFQGNAWSLGKKYGHSVGTKLPNPWGLYDMHGNVHEWVQDWYGDYSSDPETDPTGPSSGTRRVVRSGDYGNPPLYTRSAARSPISPELQYPHVGVRLLQMAEPVVTPGPSNRPPLLAAIDTRMVEEGQTVSFVLRGSDPDGDALSYSVTGNPAGSTLTGGTFSWTPSSGQAGSYSVTFTLSDGRGGTDNKVATVAVVAPTPVNQPPTLEVIGGKSIEIDQTVSFTLSASDPDGDALTYSVAGNPAGSSLTNNTFSWTPSTGQAGSYSLSFTASDGKGGTSSQPVTITVTVPVPVNQLPVLAAIEAKTIEENQTLSFVLSGSDPDGDLLTYGVAGNPSGSALSGNTFSWVPAVGQTGSYTVSFTVNDGKGGSATQSVTITVTQTPQEPVVENNPPILHLGWLLGQGGEPSKEGSLLSFTVPASDPDGDALTFSSIGNPPGSTLVGDVFSWIPTYDQAGPHTLTFSVSDGRGGTDTESIVINIAPGNRRPVLGEISDQAVREGQVVSFVVPASDLDSDPLTFSVLSNPTGATLTSDIFSWTPDIGQTGSHILVFTVDDGKGGTDSKTMTITVSQANRPPVLADIEDSVIPEGQLLSITLLGTDPEGERLTYSVSGNPPGSTLQGNVFTWTPGSGQAGSYTLNFTVTDPHGASHTQPATITVSPPNRQPVLAETIDRSIEEGQPVSFNLSATDSDGDDLIFSVSGHPAGSTLEGNTFSWTPGEGQAGIYTLTFTVSDGRGGTDRRSGTITVQKANRKPILADIADQSVLEGQTLEFTLTASDPDGDPLTYSVSGNPTGSMLSSGAFTFTPTADQTGAFDVVFTVTDDEGATDTQSVTITVTPGNHKPELVDLVPRTIEEDQTLSFTVNANDIDGDELTYSISGNPSGSRFMGNVFSWQPDIGQVGSYSVTFSVNDGEGGADTQTIIITVTEIPKPEPSSLEVTVTPVVPTEDSDIELHLDAVFPSLSATILRHFFAVDEEMVSIFLSTEQLEDTPDDPNLGWNVTEHIGRLEAGNYEIVVIVNGNEFVRTDLQVRNSSGSRGIVSIDFDSLPGNQAKTQQGGGEVGKEYDVQLHIKDIRQAFSGWSITLRFDPEEIEYIPGSFKPTEFISGLTPLEIIEPGTVEIGGTVLGQSEGASGDAELGTASFRLLDGFAEKTSIFITDNNLNFPDGGSERYPIFREAVIFEQLPVQGDFDGDGRVDFSDFFAFADAFGGSDPMFDLDGDGRVDFTDFFTFADNFGKEARAKLMRLAHEHIGLPMPLILEGSFPNPFNASTTIRYQINQTGLVQLNIFDLSGQKIRTLVEGVQEQGQYEVVWDGIDDKGKSVSAGVYFAAVRTDGVSEVRKMVYVK